eukprot:scaffold13906_cov48-Phaeocystis_antarctica.AAC.2
MDHHHTARSSSSFGDDILPLTIAASSGVLPCASRACGELPCSSRSRAASPASAPLLQCSGVPPSSVLGRSTFAPLSSSSSAAAA